METTNGKKSVDEAAKNLVDVLREGQLSGAGIDRAFSETFFKQVELYSVNDGMGTYLAIQDMHMEVRDGYDPNVCNQEGYAQRVEALLE